MHRLAVHELPPGDTSGVKWHSDSASRWASWRVIWKFCL